LKEKIIKFVVIVIVYIIVFQIGLWLDPVLKNTASENEKYEVSETKE